MKIRALVFDDNDEILELISTILLKRNYEVVEFSEAASCPVLLSDSCPCPKGYTCADIIISDLEMPNMTGLQFIESQLAHGCKVRNIAVLSGYWTPARKEKALNLGCKIIEKPFSINDLTNWLEECEKRLDPARCLWNWFEHKNKKKPVKMNA